MLLLRVYIASSEKTDLSMFLFLYKHNFIFTKVWMYIVHNKMVSGIICFSLFDVKNNYK